MDKQNDLFQLANEIRMKNPDVKEENGKARMTLRPEHQRGANQLWRNSKTDAGWKTEIVAQIRPDRTDVFGVHHVVSGDTLSKLAKTYLGDAKRYMEIFNANNDTLTDPDKNKVGQSLKIPAH